MRFTLSRLLVTPVWTPVVMLGLLLSTDRSEAQVRSQGLAWRPLEAKVDPLVDDVMKANKFVGMTVAVTKGGRLVLSKGYGYSKANILPGGGLEFAKMQRDTRTRIGSVSKAVITGPVAFEILKRLGIDPDTKTLYGPSGVFGKRYDSDIRLNAGRYYPIVAMAIAPDDKVYTWYVNRTYSVGTSNDLDRFQAPKGFTLPSSKRVTDIRAIAISKSGRVYTWFSDGTRSVGTPSNLGQQYDPDTKVQLPSGKSMWMVVGAAIAKSNDRVYVWYDDGTVSSGTSLRFALHSYPTPYTTPTAHPFTTSRFHIRGIGISSRDAVYAWYSDGSASVGSSRDLDRYRSPYGYTLPGVIRQLDGGAIYDRNVWWRRITLQQLLDHRTGFQRSGDTAGAARMFGVPETKLTYDHVHRHFLRTRPLRFRPGSASSYSNHGFGLWTLIVPALTGQSYRSYANTRYLKPLGLMGKVRPMSDVPDALDSHPYVLRNNKPVKVEFRASGLGLAAGGWTASATSVLRITRFLAKTYTPEELDAMGWGRESRGKLEHNGLIDGGTAYVAIFPKGYRSRGGKDLGDVHVALAANTRNGAALGALEKLASDIALAVPDSKIPPHFDIWAEVRTQP